MTELRKKLTYDEIFSRHPHLEELKLLERLPIYALIENIRSMHNVGSIFRTSDGVRLKKLFLTGYTARPPRQEIDKTALGSTDSVPWEYHKDPLPVIENLKKQGVKIVVVEHTSDCVSYTEPVFDYPLCLIMGNEVEGVSESLIRSADYAVEIPMLGMKQSLNVSVAYGIVLYHILSKYLKK
ncbi:MAG: RNA methyltransferase [Calditrichaceae bacterium]